MPELVKFDDAEYIGNADECVSLELIYLSGDSCCSNNTNGCLLLSLDERQNQPLRSMAIYIDKTGAFKLMDALTDYVENMEGPEVLSEEELVAEVKRLRAENASLQKELTSLSVKESIQQMDEGKGIPMKTVKAKIQKRRGSKK